MAMKTALVLALIASLSAPSVSFAAPQGAWSEVRSARAGNEVTVRAPSSDRGGRYFIRADDDAVMLLNASDPALTAGVVRLLRRFVVEHPDYFPIPEGRTHRLDNHVFLDTSGLVVDGRKLANYDEVVERIARADVEGGAVSLDINKGWPPAKQILVVLGAIVATPVVIMAIACARGCP
jgi:hypothetical protein